MNTDVEDLLREGMERFTRDLRAPSELIRGVARRRRKRLALRSAAGAAAVTAGAVALVAVVAPGGRNDGTQGLVYTGYVVNRVDSALTAADPGEIAQMTVTASSTAAGGGKTVTTTAQEWSYGDQWRSAANSSAGHPVYDEGFSSSSVYTLVSYLTRTWAREAGVGRPAAPGFGLAKVKAPAIGRLAPKLILRGVLAYGLNAAPAAAARGCKPVVSAVPTLFQPGLPGFGFSAVSLPGIGFSATSLPTAKALRAAISCGILTVAGRQVVDGTEAIELTSRPNSPISETVWVRPDTYLPVRVVVRSAVGKSVSQQTADITWLAPTAQNLSKLTVPIPAGFRQVSLPRVVLPILEQTAGTPLAKLKELCFTASGTQGRKSQCVRA